MAFKKEFFMLDFREKMSHGLSVFFVAAYSVKPWASRLDKDLLLC